MGPSCPPMSAYEACNSFPASALRPTVSQCLSHAHEKGFLSYPTARNFHYAYLYLLSLSLSRSSLCSRFFFYYDSAPERFTALPIAPPSALYVCLFRPFLLSFFFLLSLPMAIEVLQVAHARMQEGHIVSRLRQKLASFRRVRSTLVATSGSGGNIAVTSVRPFVECGQEGTTRATPGNSVGARHSVARCLY